MINFEVSYLNMFGNEYKHELKENGKNIVVTMNNRQVCVGVTLHLSVFILFLARSLLISIPTGSSTQVLTTS